MASSRNVDHSACKNRFQEKPDFLIFCQLLSKEEGHDAIPQLIPKHSREIVLSKQNFFDEENNFHFRTYLKMMTV